MITLVCPSCGGQVECTDEGRESVRCPYCGSEIFFGVRHTDAEFNNIRNANYQMEQDNLLDEKNRRSVKTWSVVRAVLIFLLAVQNYLGWLFIAIALKEENREAVKNGDFGFFILATLLIVGAFFLGLISPVILTLTRPNYNVVTKEEDKNAKVKAFFITLLINVLVWIASVTLAIISWKVFNIR